MTDRSIVYTQEQGRSVDFLFAQRAIMIAIGKLAQAALGSNTVVRGLAVTPNSPAALNVLVGIGEIYTVGAVDATTYGSLAADSDTIVQQGLNMAAQTISTPAPSTSGYSIAYLIEAQFQSQDTTTAVLPFYNSANPSIPLNGQGGSGATLPTERQGVCVIQAKAGVAATTGTQITPTVDSGWTALAVVTVANGATTVIAGNITIPAGVPQISSLVQMMQTGSSIYAIDTSTSANTITLSLTPAITAYVDGEPIRFKAANSNTGPCTINWGGGSIALNGSNGAFQGGEIIAGKQYEAQYNSTTGTAIMLGQTAGALQIPPATASQHAVNLGQMTGRLIGTQHFVTSTTYIPTTGTTSIEVEIVGGGAAGGSTNATGAGQVAIGGGGGAGGYARSRYVSGFSGVTITIGAGGTVGSPAGGTTSFGALMSATGGTQGASGATTVAAPPFCAIGGVGGIGASANIINGEGGQGIVGIAAVSSSFVSGGGGQSAFGMGGNAQGTTSNTGAASPSAGGGGAGALAGASTGAQNGGAGGPGFCLIREYS